MPGEDDGLGKKVIQRSVFREWIELSERQTTTTAAEISEDFGVPRYLVMDRLEQTMETNTACQALPFTLLLVISYASVAISHMDAQKVRAVEHSISFDVEDNANFAFDSEFAGHKDINDVNSFADFWSFTSTGLVPLLWVQEKSWSEDVISRNATVEPGLTPTVQLTPQQWGIMIYYNRIIGGIRLRQERNTVVPCVKNPELDQFYNIDCKGNVKDYGLDPDIDVARVMDADEEWTKWLWVHEEGETVAEKVKQLELTGWLDTNTEKVEISIPIYNAEYSVHSLINVNFFFTRGGHIWKHIIAQSIYANWFSSWYQFAVDGTYFGCISWIFLAEITEVAQTISQGGCRGLWNDYINIWNVVDWMAIVAGFILMFFFYWCTELSNLVNAEGEKIGKIPRPIPHATTNLPDVKLYIEQLQIGVNWVTFTQKWLARYPLVIVFRLFKSFHAQPRLALVTMTLQSSFDDLFHFLIVFFSVMLGFVTSAVVLFGREVDELVTVWRASMYCIRLILGDMDYDSLKVAGRLLAGSWMMGFMVFGSLLLLNMLLAIVMDAYSDVKSNSGGQETLWGQIRGQIKNMDGMHVPLKIIHKALANDVPEELKTLEEKRKVHAKKKKARQEAGEFDDDDDAEDDDYYEQLKQEWSLSLLKAEHLKEVVSNPSERRKKGVFGGRSSKKKQWTMADAQAREIIIGTIQDYYDQNQESADNFEFISSAEKIDTRLNLIVNLHKRFNLREDAKHELAGHEDIDDDDDEEKEDQVKELKDQVDTMFESQGSDFVEEPHLLKRGMSKIDSDMKKAMAADLDVRDCMSEVHDEFFKFLEDSHADRLRAIRQISRLNLEVTALRDRLSETSAPGSLLPSFVLSDVLPSRQVTAEPTRASQISAGSRRASGPRLSRLDEEPGSAESDDGCSVSTTAGPRAPQTSSLNLATNRASAGMAFTDRMPPVEEDKPAGAGDDTRLSAERLASLQKKPLKKGASLAYLQLMKRQGMLPADYQQPDQGSDSGWQDDNSLQGSTPPGSAVGAPASRRVPRPGGSGYGGSSAGSQVGERLSDFDESEYLESIGDFDHASMASEDDIGDAPVGVAFRMHGARVGDGVGLGASNADYNEEVPPQDFEFTTFRDAQSQLRTMLSRHRPAGTEGSPDRRSEI